MVSSCQISFKGRLLKGIFLKMTFQYWHEHFPQSLAQNVSESDNQYSRYVYIYNAVMVMFVQWFPNFTSWCPQENPVGIQNPLSLLSLSPALGLLTYNNYVRAKMKKRAHPLWFWDTHSVQSILRQIISLIQPVLCKPSGDPWNWTRSSLGRVPTPRLRTNDLANCTDLESQNKKMQTPYITEVWDTL